MRADALRTDDETSLDQEKKDKVLRAALELFGRYGFKKTTMDEIAEAAGMSKRTVYEVFKGKENILAELVMSEALHFRKMLIGRIKPLSDPVEKLELFCNLSTDYFDKNPFLGQVLFDREDLYEPFLGGEIHTVEAGMRDIIANLLREGMRKGVFREMDIQDNAQCVFVLYRGFTYQRGDVQNGSREWTCFALRALMAER
ncbi:MAG: TetR/AcrR family transcriptional regulator [Anaerolineae bacterium]